MIEWKKVKNGKGTFPFVAISKRLKQMLLKQIQFSLYLIKETGCFLFQQMVLKINGIFEARRGKKKMKRVSPSTESNSGRGVCKSISHIHM